MKNKIVKKLAVLLAGIMIFTGIPAQGLHAEESKDKVVAGQDAAAESGNVSINTNPENKAEEKQPEASTEVKEPETEEKETEPEVKKPETEKTEEKDGKTEAAAEAEQEGSNAEQKNEETKQPEEAVEPEKEMVSELNYLFVNKPELQSDETQSFMVSWGGEKKTVTDMELLIENEEGEKTALKSSKNAENVYLFEEAFAKGVYHVAGLKVASDDGEKEFTAEELGVNAYFGVEREYSGDEKSDYIEAEQIGEEAPEVEASIVTIDKDGNEKAADSIESALSEAAAAQQPKARTARAAETKAGNLVVVLDPGHDSKHAGNQGNGTKEEVVSLKIAQYCKEELEKYSGVTVYMTRTTGACPFPNSADNIDDIKKRTDWAKTKGADVFISFHTNSSTSSAAKGAEVYYPEGNADAKDLAQQILNGLTALGISDRGVKESTGYAVVKYSKQNGFPGLIIEHAFASNASDAKWFKSEANLKKLGVSDAQGIAKHYGLTKDSGKWKTENGKTYYYLNGVLVKGEKKIGNNWYHFDETTGEMTVGFYSFPKKTVYYNSSGEMVHGEKKIDGKWYMFHKTTGAMQTGFYNHATKTVYYTSSGYMSYGELAIGADLYYFDAVTGAMATGWRTYSGKKVYFSLDGKMARGEVKIGGKWYMFHKTTGAMQTGFYNHASKTVYYGEDGAMLYGKQVIAGKTYYFDKTTGAQKLSGEVKQNGKWYYFDAETGNMKTGWHTFPSKKVYYGSDGAMVYGEKKIEGKWYMFHKTTGAMQTGLYKHATKTVYYGPSGDMKYGEQKISNKWHYFDNTTGAMKIGWFEFPNKKVFYNSNGEMVYGEQKIDGKLYAFDKTTGALIREGWYNKKYYGADGVRVDNLEQVLYKIEGKTSTSVGQMVNYYNKYKGKNVQYPAEALAKGGAPDITTLATIFYEEANKEGIKAEVVWTQSMKETGFLKFGGDVVVEQFNFAGLGTTGGGVQGAYFADVRTGVRAQVQHMKAYASKTITESTLKEKCVDPRFNLVSKGCAPYVEMLGQKENPEGKGWATAARYGYSIVDMIGKLKKS